MQNELTSRGLPHAIAQDAWWLDAEPGTFHNKPNNRAAFFAVLQGPQRPIFALAIVIPSADLLFWNGGLGVSVALFACVLWAAVVIIARPAGGLGKAFVVLMFGAAPVVEYLQLLSAAFLVIGTAIAIVWVKRPDLPFGMVTAHGVRFLQRLPGVWMRLPLSAIRHLVGSVPQSGFQSKIGSFRHNWAFPIGGACVFGALIIEANPVLWTVDVQRFDVGELVQRALFWGGFALMAWPVLITEVGPVPIGPRRPISSPMFGINAGSVIRSLWLFNAMIAVQTILDLSILFGGTALPEGMSYAAYAHRGAYPLLAMALLAGAFAMAARPYLNEAAAMRPLMYLWLGQNIVVCGSAFLRLDLYIDVYGLTYMRIYAQVWMGLVAVGLALTVWQVWRGQSSAWLLMRCAALAGVVLYGACFVNFAKVIVDHNITLADPDFAYMCRLNPTSGIYRHVTTGQTAYGYDVCYFQTPHIENWQELGFRTWRALP